MNPRDHKVDRLEVKIVVEQLLSGEAKGVRGPLHGLLTPSAIRKRVGLLEQALAEVIEEHLGAVTEGDLARHSEYREGRAFSGDDIVIDCPLREARGDLADLGWACDDFDASVADARAGGWSAKEARELAQEDCALAAALDRAHDALLAVCIGLAANDDPDPTDGGGVGCELSGDVLCEYCGATSEMSQHDRWQRWRRCEGRLLHNPGCGQPLSEWMPAALAMS